MNAVPPSITPGSAATKWAALHDTADVIATLAGLPNERSDDVGGFPAWMRDAAPWRRELAQRGIDDITAALTHGLSTLLGLEARGGDPRGAALALWREFSSARSAVLALSPLAAA